MKGNALPLEQTRLEALEIETLAVNYEALLANTIILFAP